MQRFPVNKCGCKGLSQIKEYIDDGTLSDIERLKTFKKTTLPPQQQETNIFPPMFPRKTVASESDYDSEKSEYSGGESDNNVDWARGS